MNHFSSVGYISSVSYVNLGNSTSRICFVHLYNEGLDLFRIKSFKGILRNGFSRFFFQRLRITDFLGCMRSVRGLRDLEGSIVRDVSSEIPLNSITNWLLERLM